MSQEQRKGIRSKNEQQTSQQMQEQLQCKQETDVINLSEQELTWRQPKCEEIYIEPENNRHGRREVNVLFIE